MSALHVQFLWSERRLDEIFMRDGVWEAWHATVEFPMEDVSVERRRKLLRLRELDSGLRNPSIVRLLSPPIERWRGGPWPSVRLDDYPSLDEVFGIIDEMIAAMEDQK